ncbi:MAG: phosphate transporter substrate-binding protein, partial [Lacunisphaera sp.]|nr:phosphate transporter substrate-binding protein [Lacunisphaera sp.]
MKSRTLLSALLAFVTVGPLVAQTEKASTGLVMQEARAENLKVKGPKIYYAADKFDLSGLPAYQPKEKVTGTIRLWGSNYIVDGKVGEYWEKEFQKFHPGV